MPTEIKQPEIDLKMFQLAVENALDLIHLVNREGNIMYSNNAVMAVTGYSKEEALGKKPNELWKTKADPLFQQRMWKQVIEEKKVFRGEMKNSKKNGEVYFAEITIIPIVDEKNTVLFFVITERDISKAKEIERKKNEFVSLASHQLRTPLTAVKWTTQLFLNKKSENLSNEQKGYLQNIYESNERLIKMVNDLLEITQIEGGVDLSLQPKLVNVTNLITEIIREQSLEAHRKNINILFQNRLKRNILLFIDEDKIKKAINNLVDNAQKYSYEQRDISIGCLEDEQNNFVLYIQDRGIGIPEGDQSRVFEKFYRGSNALTFDAESNGLSLFITKGIIEAHGGKIWFESKEGQGSTFYISLPIDRNIQ